MEYSVLVFFWLPVHYGLEWWASSGPTTTTTTTRKGLTRLTGSSICGLVSGRCRRGEAHYNSIRAKTISLARPEGSRWRNLRWNYLTTSVPPNRKRSWFYLWFDVFFSLSPLRDTLFKRAWVWHKGEHCQPIRLVPPSQSIFSLDFQMARRAAQASMKMSKGLDNEIVFFFSFVYLSG